QWPWRHYRYELNRLTSNGTRRADATICPPDGSIHSQYVWKVGYSRRSSSSSKVSQRQRSAKRQNILSVLFVYGQYEGTVAVNKWRMPVFRFVTLSQSSA